MTIVSWYCRVKKDAFWNVDDACGLGKHIRGSSRQHWNRVQVPVPLFWCVLLQLACLDILSPGRDFDFATDHPVVDICIGAVFAFISLEAAFETSCERCCASKGFLGRRKAYSCCPLGCSRENMAWWDLSCSYFSKLSFLPVIKLWKLEHFLSGYEIIGFERIPETGPALLIYYHGAIPIDFYYILARTYLYKRRMIRAVGDRFLFKTPGEHDAVHLR